MVTYIEVTDGKYSGARGYITDHNINKKCPGKKECIIYLNQNRIRKILHSSEYQKIYRKN